MWSAKTARSQIKSEVLICARHKHAYRTEAGKDLTPLPARVPLRSTSKPWVPRRPDGRRRRRSPSERPALARPAFQEKTPNYLLLPSHFSSGTTAQRPGCPSIRKERKGNGGGERMLFGGLPRFRWISGESRREGKVSGGG